MLCTKQICFTVTARDCAEVRTRGSSQSGMYNLTLGSEYNVTLKMYMHALTCVSMLLENPSHTIFKTCILQDYIILGRIQHDAVEYLTFMFH
jgi:hypothetical protein